MKDLISILCLLSIPLVKIIIVLIIIACLLPDGWLKDVLCFLVALLIILGVIGGFIIYCINFFK
ncbi:MAG: hypothetical protein IJB79_08275 [Candidatus Gastranaerophilales bacterium]|nr:hypothetical protein [Candidatus Gastranaerophilales bacterium]